MFFTESEWLCDRLTGSDAFDVCRAKSVGFTGGFVELLVEEGRVKGKEKVFFSKAFLRECQFLQRFLWDGELSLVLNTV